LKLENVWNSAVTQKSQNNFNIKNKQNNNDCSICTELLDQMQRFFDMLESARKTHNSDWLTVEDIAEELRISKNVVYRLIRNGELEAVNLVETNGHIAQRGHYRIKRSCLNRYLDSRKVNPIPNKTIRVSSPRRFPKVKNHLGL